MTYSPKKIELSGEQIVCQRKRLRVLSSADKLKKEQKENRLRFFIPTEKQEEFLRSKANIRLLFGANKVGKTFSGMIETISFALGYRPYLNPEDPDFYTPFEPPVRIRVVGEDFTNHIGHVLVPRLKELMPKSDFTYERNNPRKNGARIEALWTLDNKSTVEFMCFRGDQRVLMADGVYKPIKDISTGENVISIIRNGRNGYKQSIRKVSKVWNNHTDKFLEIEFTKGRKLICSKEHEIFTNKGWKLAGQLKIDDRLPTPIYNIESKDNIPDWILVMTATLIGDGSIKGWQCQFTSAREKQVEEIKKYLPDFLHLQIHNKNHNGANDYCISLNKDFAVKNNPLKKQLTKWGLWNKGSKDKFVPDEIFKQNDKKIALFLRFLFATDGCFTGHQIKYYSISSKLAEDVKLLLHRLGIKSTLKKRYNNTTGIIRGKEIKTVGWYYWTQISSQEHLKKFADLIGFAGRDEELKKFIEKNSSRVYSKNEKLISRRNNTCIVKSIKEIEGGNSYDLEIEDSHTYIVDGLIVHNSAEQDVGKFEGWDGHLFWFDEPPSYDVFIACMRGAVSYGGCAMVTATILKNYWLKEQIYDKWKAGEADYYAVNLEMRDNLIHTRQWYGKEVKTGGLSEINIQRFERMLDGNDAEKEVRIKGGFLYLSGLVLDKLNPEKHFLPEGNEPNLDNCTFYEAIDPHPKTPFAVTFLAVTPEGIKYVYDELDIKDTIANICQAIIAKRKGTPRFTLIDPMAFILDPDTKKCWADKFKECGVKVTKSFRSEDAKSQGVIRINEALSEEKLFFLDKCQHHKKQAQGWVWDSPRGRAAEKREAAHPIKKDDHFMENLYRLMVHDTRYKSFAQSKFYDTKFIKTRQGKSLFNAGVPRGIKNSGGFVSNRFGHFLSR